MRVTCLEVCFLRSSIDRLLWCGFFQYLLFSTSSLALFFVLFSFADWNRDFEPIQKSPSEHYGRNKYRLVYIYRRCLDDMLTEESSTSHNLLHGLILRMVCTACSPMILNVEVWRCECYLEVWLIIPSFILCCKIWPRRRLADIGQCACGDLSNECCILLTRIDCSIIY